MLKVVLRFAFIYRRVRFAYGPLERQSDVQSPLRFVMICLSMRFHNFRMIHFVNTSKKNKAEIKYFIVSVETMAVGTPLKKNATPLPNSKFLLKMSAKIFFH